MNSAKSVSTLSINSVRYGSRDNLFSPRAQSTVKSQNEKEKNILILLVSYINENMSTIGLNDQTKWTLRNLEKLSSDDMLKIIVFLLRDVNMQDQAVNKPGTLPFFEHHTYNMAIDEIYHKLKKIFYEDNKFLYPVLLLPSQDPKKTRYVLAYIMQFVLMASHLQEDLESAYAAVAEENKEKQEIFHEVEDLCNQLSDAIQVKESNAMTLPSLQKKLGAMKISNLNLEARLKQQEAILDTTESAYVNFKEELQLLSQQLELLTVEISSVKDDVVENPQLLLGNIHTIKKHIEAALRQRDSSEFERQKTSEEEATFERINAIIAPFLENLKKINQMLEDLRLKRTIVSKTLEYRQKEIEVANKNECLRKKHLEMLTQTDCIVNDAKMQCHKLSLELSEITKEISGVAQKKKEIIDKSHETAEHQEKISQEIDVLMQSIQSSVSIVHEAIPNARSEQEKKAKEVLERVHVKFSDFSLPPPTNNNTE